MQRVYYWIQSKGKSLGILLSNFLFFRPPDSFHCLYGSPNYPVDKQGCVVFLRWSRVHHCCQSMRVPQPWENNIYGNGKSIKHLSYCFPCSTVFKNDSVSSGWKKKNNIRNTLLSSFENDNVWVLDFEKRSLNIKKKEAVKSFTWGVFNFWMCLQPSVPVIAYPLQFCNLPTTIIFNLLKLPLSPLHPDHHRRHFVCSCFLSISGLKFLYFIVNGCFSFNLSSLMCFCLT